MARLESAMPSAATPEFEKIDLLPKQRAFIEALWMYDYLLYAGGFGSGKTLVGCYAGILLSLLCPHNFGLVGRQHASDLRDSTQRTWFECIPQSFIAKWKPTEGHLWLKNGSEILFRHLDEPQGLKSLSLGWAWADELTDVGEPVFRMLQSRLRLPVRLPPRDILATKDGWAASKMSKDGPSARKFFATTNTDSPEHWVHGAWYGPPPPDGIGLPEAKRFAITAPSRENRHLPPEYIADMDASYDPKYHERYVQGKWISLSREATYYNFSSEKHVRPCPIDEYLPVITAWDFNRNPMACAICQQRGQETWVIDEILIQNSSTPEVCDEFLRRYERLLTRGPCPSIKVYGDATGKSRSATTGLADYGHIAQKFKHLRSLSFHVPNANGPVVDRVAATNSRLLANDGAVRLFIDPKCVHLINDFLLVHNKRGTREIDRPTSTEIEKGSNPMISHLSDAISYYLVAAFPVKKPSRGLRTYNIPGV